MGAYLPKIIIKTKSVALSAGDEKSGVLPRSFTNKADSVPFTNKQRIYKQSRFSSIRENL